MWGELLNSFSGGSSSSSSSGGGGSHPTSSGVQGLNTSFGNVNFGGGEGLNLSKDVVLYLVAGIAVVFLVSK